MNLFGTKKKKAPAPKLSDSIQKLHEASENLDKREKHLVKLMEQALIEAKKKSKAKDKRGALFNLKRKKMYEKQIDQIYGKKTNIDLQILALEGASSNKDVIVAMQAGARALQAAVAETNVDRVDEVMDDIQESMGLADELGEAISQPIGPAMDEDELSAELAEMEGEMMDEDLLSAPSVPVKKLSAEDDEKVPEERVSSKPKVVAPTSKKEVVLAGGGGKSSGGSSKSKVDQELADLEAAMGI